MGVRRLDPAPIIQLWCDPQGRPRLFVWRRRARVVAAIRHRWALKAEWWRGDDAAIARDHYDLVTRDGLRCVIFHDRVADVWHLESVYD
ncbi:MAG TPA: DUF6504 family protein [Thermomicrobiales bacterium]|jgi:hypothetical protein